ncbi:MAG: AMP-binding protein [Actinobacteria bacterium]|nr:AMP-binding protein [Actinomycetota bacterium]
MSEDEARIGAVDPRALLPEEIRSLRAAMEAEWRRLGLHRGETLGEAVRRGAELFPDTELVFHSAVRPATLTLAGLLARAERIAGAWHRLGLREGDVIAIQMPNWAETALAYAAAGLLGAVFVPIVQIYGPVEVGFVLRQSRARALLVPTRFRRLDYGEGLTGLGELPDLDFLFTVGEGAPAGAIDWGELEGGADGACPASTRGAADIATVIYTSGTTAEPKGVQHSSDSLVAELHGSPTPPPGVPGTVSLQPFPAGHTAGLCAMLGPFAHGYKTVMVDSWDAEVGVRLVEEHGVTAMAGTPFFIDTILDAAAAGGGDISSLRHGITGGAGVPPSLIERADRIGWRVARCYGATEGPSMTASESGDDLDHRARSDGRPLAGNRLRILDEAGAEVPAGEVGEIVAIGPEHFVSYSDPAFNLDAFTADGWLRTGDIGRVDADGYLTITDRRKDIIIRGGENISSKEVEDVLITHPAVREGAVTGAPDPRYGEVVCAFVVVEPGARIDLDAVREHFFATGIARQKTPERLVEVRELPRTAAGKVKKHELRAALAAADG